MRITLRKSEVSSLNMVRNDTKLQSILVSRFVCVHSVTKVICFSITEFYDYIYERLKARQRVCQ